jgi:hypothetical protein
MSLRRPFVAPRSTKLTASKTMLEDNNGEMTSPKNVGIANTIGGYDQTPIEDWRVSDDEEDSVPISQLIVAQKEKVRGHRKTPRQNDSERKVESKTTADKSRPHVIPFNKGIKVLSYREALEVTENYGAKHNTLRTSGRYPQSKTW